MKKSATLLIVALALVIFIMPTVVAAQESPPEFLLKWGSYGSDNGTFKEPSGIAVDSEGNVYVADRYNHRIQKFTSDGGFLTTWGTFGYSGNGKFREPMDVAVDASGNVVYVVDMFNGRIQKFDSNGNFLIKWGTSGSGDGKFSMPQGIAVDSSGNVYVADSYNRRIQKFTSDGTFITKWGSGGGMYDCPYGITVDSEDNVYVAIWHYINKFDSSGTPLNTWYCHGAVDVDVDPNGNVYVVVNWDNIFGQNITEIKKFDSDGNSITSWGDYGSDNGKFDHPRGIAVDSEGNIYVADTENNRIQVFAGNQPPVAEAGDNQTAIVGEEITFDGSNSYDEDGTIVSYEWDFDDGDAGSGNITTHSYSSGGIYEVQLTVTDDDGAIDTDTIIVTVQTLEEAIQDLILYVEEIGLPTGVENSLISKLENAISSLNRNQKTAAINKLNAFINEVEAQRDKNIMDEADELIDRAQRVIDNM